MAKVAGSATRHRAKNGCLRDAVLVIPQGRTTFNVALKCQELREISQVHASFAVT